MLRASTATSIVDGWLEWERDTVVNRARYSTFKKGWKQARKTAGGNGLHFHDLRREFASRLLETPGVSLHDVADWVGHSNVTTTSRYLRTTAVRREHIAKRFKEARSAALAPIVATTESDQPASRPS